MTYYKISIRLLINISKLKYVGRMFRRLTTRVRVRLLGNTFTIRRPLRVLMCILPLSVLTIDRSFRVNGRVTLRLNLIGGTIIFVRGNFMTLITRSSHFLRRTYIRIPFLLIYEFNRSMGSWNFAYGRSRNSVIAMTKVMIGT